MTAAVDGREISACRSFAARSKAETVMESLRRRTISTMEEDDDDDDDDDDIIDTNIIDHEG